VVLYVKLASRIGLGIALGSRIFRGRDGYAGELGHVLVDPDGGRCWCGRTGCLELYAGGDGILRRLGERAPETLGELVARSRAGDPEVVALVDQAAERLARALGDIALILDPSAVLIGGELAALGEQVLAPVRESLTAAPFGVPTEVAVSPLGERASLLGALALVLSESDHFVDRSSPPVRPRAGDPAPEASPWGRGAHLVTSEPSR
jgi:predicted NBD/HSP70 family sugar kinase